MSRTVVRSAARAAPNRAAKFKIISTGLCRCVIEPRGGHNLDGYAHGQTYRYVECRGPQGRYFRVYRRTRRFETCGPGVFSRYFVVCSDPALEAAAT